MGDPDPKPHKVNISEPNMESGDQEPDHPGDTFDEDDEVVGTGLGLVRIMIEYFMKVYMKFYMKSSRSTKNTRSIYSIDKGSLKILIDSLGVENKIIKKSSSLN